MIDPNIPLQVRPLRQQDPVEPYAQALTLAQLLRQGRSQEMQFRLQERAMADDDAVREAIAAAGGDLRKALPGIMTAAPKQGLAYGTALSAQQKAALDQQKTKLDMLKEQNAAVGQAMGAVLSAPPEVRPQLYSQHLTRLVQQGILSPQDAPPDYDEAWMFGQYRASLDAGKQLEGYYKQLEEERSQDKWDVERPGAIARSLVSEQQAAGTVPVTPYQRETLRQGDTRIYNERDAALATDKYRTAVLDATKRGQELIDQRAREFHAISKGNVSVSHEGKLRDDYRQDARMFATVRDGYGRMMEAARSTGGPADISLLYGYMKILDPGSTVREGEFATARNAGSAFERVGAWYNRILKGEQLDKNVRRQFIEEAQKIYSRAEADNTKLRGWYRETSLRGGMNPDNVLVDYGSSLGGPKILVTDPDGGVHTFNSQADADAFKLDAGIK